MLLAAFTVATLAALVTTEGLTSAETEALARLPYAVAQRLPALPAPVDEPPGRRRAREQGRVGHQQQAARHPPLDAVREQHRADELDQHEHQQQVGERQPQVLEQLAAFIMQRSF